MSVPLSPDTQRRVTILFRAEDQDEAAALLVEECGNNIPFLEQLDEFMLERFRFAALKLSGGDLARLHKAVQLAKGDWRDLLVAAGFADDVDAHRRWLA